MIAEINNAEDIDQVKYYNTDKVKKDKAKVLDFNCIDLDPKRLNKSIEEGFNTYLSTNSRIKKPMLHISLNPHPDDKMSEYKQTAIAHEFMQEMGYKDQPYVIFKHEDIDRHHLHIITTPVQMDGKIVNRKFEKKRAISIARALEKKYGLIPIDQPSQSDLLGIAKINPQKPIAKQIKNTVYNLTRDYQCTSIGELAAGLSIFNVGLEIRKGEVNNQPYKGIVFVAKDDNEQTIATPIKASRLSKKFTLPNLEINFKKNKGKRKIFAPLICSAFERAKSLKEFQSILKKRNIDLVLRLNDKHIIGATYIDHKNKIIQNGSSIDKILAGLSLENKFPDFKKEYIKPDLSLAQQKDFLKEEKTQFKLQPSVQFEPQDNATYNPTIEGLILSSGVLDDEGNINDKNTLLPEIKKKKKKRKRKTEI